MPFLVSQIAKIPKDDHLFSNKHLNGSRNQILSKVYAKNLYTRREFLSFEGISKILQPLTRILCILYVATKLSSWVCWFLWRTFFRINKICVTRQIRSPNLTIYKDKRNETFSEC